MKTEIKTGQIVKKAIENAGISQYELSKRMGVCRNHISHLIAEKSGMASVRTLCRVADALEMKLSDLIKLGE